MSALPARDAYRRWAATYDAETAVSFLEDRVVTELGVETAGRTLLDVGCGVGRRLRDSNAALAVGIDLTVEMLAASTSAMRGSAADARALPFRPNTFDVVWCRLMVGHLPETEALFAELARVCRPNGHVIVSDLAAEAVRAGHQRTFRDADGVTREVEHYVHSADAQRDAAHRAGLELCAHRLGHIGPAIESFYAEAGRLSLYEQQRGTPLVLVLSFQKRGAPA